MVILRFDLVVRDPDQEKANREVQARAAKILAMLDERKIEERKVVATNLTSEPQYEIEDESYRKRGKIVGYKVTRNFAARVRDVGIFPKLVDDLMAVAGVEFTSIDSGLSMEKEIKDEVWDKALADARQQAEKTVKATGMKIDSVFALSPVAFREIPERMHEGFQGGGGSLGVETSPQYRLAPVTITQTVHVIYLISSAK